MSFMKGDLLNRTRKLVKGLAMAEPRWLKAMEQLGSSVSLTRIFFLYAINSSHLNLNFAVYIDCVVFG